MNRLLFCVFAVSAVGTIAALTVTTEPALVTLSRQGDAYYATTARERYRFARRPPSGPWMGELRLHEHDVLLGGEWVPSLRCGACDLVPNRQLTDQAGVPTGTGYWLGGAHGRAQEVSARWLADGQAANLQPGEAITADSLGLDLVWIGYADRGGSPSAAIAVHVQVTITAEQYRYRAEVTSLADQRVVLDYVGAQGAVTPCYSPPGAWEWLQVDGATELDYGGCPQPTPETESRAATTELGVGRPGGMALTMSTSPTSSPGLWTRKGTAELKSYWRPLLGVQRAAGQTDVYEFIRRLR